MPASSSSSSLNPRKARVSLNNSVDMIAIHNDLSHFYLESV
jgi:hypothetical protein